MRWATIACCARTMNGNDRLLGATKSADLRWWGREVVSSSYLQRTCQLMAFFYRGRPTLVDVRGKINKMDATLCFLTCLYPHDRQCDIAAERLAQEFFHREMAKEILAHSVERYYRSAIVLRHQQEQRGRCMLIVRH